MWGASQIVDGVTSATAHLINSGIISGRAFASAVATGTVTGFETASAIALPWIIEQQAAAINPTGAAALVQIDNTGTAAALTLSGTAFASGEVALASVDFVAGGLDAIEQRVLAQATTGPAVATGVFNNDGTVRIVGNATAVSPLGAGGSADATVNLSWFIDQAADATGTAPAALLQIINDGLIHGEANAIATGSNAFVSEAQARGLRQDVEVRNGTGVFRFGTGSAVFTNNGTLSALAFGQAIGGTFADAEADASGIQQQVDAGFAIASVVNNGDLIVNASAVASATAGGAIAQVTGTGISQTARATLTGGQASALVDNVGVVSVLADATAIGTIATADAFATGISQNVVADGSAARLCRQCGHAQCGRLGGRFRRRHRPCLRRGRGNHPVGVGRLWRQRSGGCAFGPEQRRDRGWRVRGGQRRRLRERRGLGRWREPGLHAIRPHRNADTPSGGHSGRQQQRSHRRYGDCLGRGRRLELRLCGRGRHQHLRVRRSV